MKTLLSYFNFEIENVYVSIVDWWLQAEDLRNTRNCMSATLSYPCSYRNVSKPFITSSNYKNRLRWVTLHVMQAEHEKYLKELEQKA